MFGMRTTGKIALLAAGLLLTSNVALGAPLGLRLRPFGVMPYGIGYYYPGYYASPFGYSVYGPGYGFSIRYGYGIYGMQLGYGLGPAYGGVGYGAYGFGVPGAGYGAALYPPGSPLAQQQRQPGAMLPAAPQRQQPGRMPAAAPPQRARPGQIPQPTPVPPDEQEDKAPAEDNTARVTVVVPDGAELWFNGTKTNQTGKRREFATAPLTPGKAYRYKIKARWIEDGKPVELTQTIRVRANSTQTVDFTNNPEAPAPE